MKNPNIAPSIEQMPEYLSTQHLIQLGIYPSIDAAYQSRINGYSPEFIKLRHKILYSKNDVIKFLESRKNSARSRIQDPSDSTQNTSTCAESQ